MRLTRSALVVFQTAMALSSRLSTSTRPNGSRTMCETLQMLMHGATAPNLTIAWVVVLAAAVAGVGFAAWPHNSLGASRA